MLVCKWRELWQFCTCIRLGSIIFDLWMTNLIRCKIIDADFQHEFAYMSLAGIILVHGWARAFFDERPRSLIILDLWMANFNNIFWFFVTVCRDPLHCYQLHDLTISVQTETQESVGACDGSCLIRCYEMIGQDCSNLLSRASTPCANNVIDRCIVLFRLVWCVSPMLT